MSHRDSQGVFGLAFCACQFGVGRGELAESFAVGEDRYGFLEHLEVLDSQEHG